MKKIIFIFALFTFQLCIAVPLLAHVTQPPAISGSEIGLWRFADNEGVELVLLNSNSKFEVGTYYKNGSGAVVEGQYKISGGQLALTNTSVNGSPGNDASLPFVLNGDIAVINGDSYQRVPMGYVLAVLSNPLSTYPPASSGATVPENSMKLPKPASPQPTPSGDGSIVGMWRMYLNDGDGEVQIFNADGTFGFIRTHSYFSTNIFTGFSEQKQTTTMTRGTYAFSNGYLVYNHEYVYLFEGGDVPGDQIAAYAKSLNQMYNIMDNGSKSDVWAIIDPKNALYSCYRSPLARDIKDWNDGYAHTIEFGSNTLTIHTNVTDRGWQWKRFVRAE